MTRAADVADWTTPIIDVNAISTQNGLLIARFSGNNGGALVITPKTTKMFRIWVWGADLRPTTSIILPTASYAMLRVQLTKDPIDTLRIPNEVASGRPGGIQVPTLSAIIKVTSGTASGHWYVLYSETS